MPRQGSRDRAPADYDRPPPYPGQIINDTRPEAAPYTDRERDNRYREAAAMQQQSRPVAGRPIVPNGYKPGQGRRPERTTGGRPNPAIITAPGVASDSDDDEDWC